MHTVVGVHGRKLFQTKNRAERVIGSCFMRTHVCMYRLYLCLSRTEHYVCNVSDTNTAVYPNPKQFYRPTYPRRHIEHDVHPLTQQRPYANSLTSVQNPSPYIEPQTPLSPQHTPPMCLCDPPLARNSHRHDYESNAVTFQRYRVPHPPISVEHALVTTLYPHPHPHPPREKSTSCCPTRRCPSTTRPSTKPGRQPLRRNGRSSNSYICKYNM